MAQAGDALLEYLGEGIARVCRVTAAPRLVVSALSPNADLLGAGLAAWEGIEDRSSWGVECPLPHLASGPT